MAVASDSKDVANLACDLVGLRPINTIENPVTTNEIIISRNYDSARRSTLREGVWNFAKTYAAISRNGTPPFKYADSYKLPNDYLRLLVVGGETEDTMVNNYDVSRRNLYTNNGGEASINIMYIADVKDVKVWDVLFLRLVVLKLALDIAYQILKDDNAVARINKLLMLEFPSALSIDGQERPPRRVQRSVYRDARMGYSSPAHIVDFDE